MACDIELMERVARREPAAFEALHERYADRIRAYLRSQLRCSELVEETLYDVLWVVWNRASCFDGRAELSTWMLGIARHKARKCRYRIARERAARVREESERDLEASLVCDDDPERILIRRQACERALQALRALTPEQRAALELSCVQGLGYSEIASRLGCPVNTVKTRVFHARRRLAARIDEPIRGSTELHEGDREPIARTS